MAENGENNPSRPGLRGIGSGNTQQETEANHEDMENDPNVTLTNARKGGNHGQSWEDAERRDDNAQDTKHTARDTHQRSKASGQAPEDKRTGYDDTHEDGGEEMDKHGNEK